jgi:hypothetical protein
MRRGGLFVLTMCLPAALALPACSAGIKQEYDPEMGRRITRMSGNVVTQQVCLVEHSLELNGAVVEEAGGTAYMLSAESSGPAYVRPLNLVLRIDGAALRLDEPLPQSAAVACPEETGTNTNLPMGGQLPACVYTEAYWFRVDPEILRRLADAREVVVELQGEEGTIKRQFTPPNFEKFQEFVALYVPLGDGR